MARATAGNPAVASRRSGISLPNHGVAVAGPVLDQRGDGRRVATGPVVCRGRLPGRPDPIFRARLGGRFVGDLRNRLGREQAAGSGQLLEPLQEIASIGLEVGILEAAPELRVSVATVALL